MAPEIDGGARMRGILVAIDGIDGAGKTTQAAHLTEMLERAGIPVVRTKEPTDGRWGQVLRRSASTGRLSAKEELAAFVEDRREHVGTLIEPALEAGKVVIVDRYYFSTVAYQGARGLDPVAIMKQNEEFAPEPDLLVFLEVEPALGVSRIGTRGDVGNLFEREEDLRRSAAIFAGIAKPYLLRLEGGLPREELTRRIWSSLVALPYFRGRDLTAAGHGGP